MGREPGALARLVLKIREKRVTHIPAALGDFYRGRRVLITGHTGFKGSWLTLWLTRLGAEVHGIALAPDQGADNLFDCAAITQRCESHLLNICDAAAVSRCIHAIKPEIVFHLAARALVQQGYEDPVGTFSTNALGTVHVLEAARQCKSVAALVCVTTDKVYRNREWAWSYRETDELGGLDPYSASKAAAEMAVRTYRHALRPNDRRFAIATARGGNVIGGGDWSRFRLIPDIVRAIRADEPLTLRYPGATRPWQHVLDLCHGYLLLGMRLAAEGQTFDEQDGCWNFGPAPDAELTVAEVVQGFFQAWGTPEYPVEMGPVRTYEAMTLRLDPSLANRVLGWGPGLDAAGSIAWTAEWYRDYLADHFAAAALVERDLTRFEDILSRSDRSAPVVRAAKGAPPC